MDPENKSGTVLLVDDDEEFLEAMNTLLTHSGYKTVAVTDALIAADEVERVRPNVVLLDIKMPGKSGLEVAYDIRRTPGTAHIPIVAMSAFFSETTVPFLELCGIKKCLKKPFNPLDLIDLIEKALPE